ncbi:hypothetical protein A2442_02340 [Candidatus Campbellbacteria bacterium RIFOXYC2_FULL_35_25]|uniref:Transglycosylase SLT domain-containing protein n=1 Tax=Candidatus Campbellbacteria bacterium RIFOXYC2_FULL_35_25 TaxID=1797582 RepID=A0A1F5EHG9_9BACT|nr:MAG: hypothetical protein A2442_02340 [Candidatus Campbellbacteria bacterium RIFOXYC2_FULL_35_25]
MERTKNIWGLVAVSILLMFFIFPFIAKSEVTCSIDLDNKTDSELASALKKCEEEIAEQEKMLQSKQRESVTIERDIDILRTKISKTQADIRAKDIKIYQLNGDITSKVEIIADLNKRFEKTTLSISELIRRTNEIDSFSSVEAILSGQSLSDFFIDVDNFSILKKDLKNNLEAIKQIKEETQTAKDILEEQQSKEQALKVAKEQEKRNTENYKAENEVLLGLNRNQEKEYQQIIAEKEKIKNEIRNRMFRTVGGTELRFEEALKLIQPYEGRIGVEAALVLAVLTQESAVDGVIGSNLGKCTYNQPVTRNKSGTVMSNTQKPSFLAIMEELNMNPDTTPVSCPIYSDGAYGGAMGPSQFMPSTWWDVEAELGYKKRVAKVLGIRTPSPFINLDAFTGTALYLSDARFKCSGPGGFDNQFEIWSCSAAKYYSGLSSSGSRLAQHMTSKWSYGYKVAERAQAFQKDIDTLNL